MTSQPTFLFLTNLNLTLCAQWAAGSSTRVVWGRAPCHVPKWGEHAKNNPFLKKLNELSENVSFDSEFALAFEIQPFKVAFFVFLNANFSKYSRAEWLNELWPYYQKHVNQIILNNRLVELWTRIALLFPHRPSGLLVSHPDVPLHKMINIYIVL